jgi:hypothetical protein
MSNDISIVKNVIDRQPHKVSGPNDITLNLKEKFIGIVKNQKKFLISKTRITEFNNKKETLTFIQNLAKNSKKRK